MKKLLLILFLLLSICAYAFAGKMIIKNNILIKYKANKYEHWEDYSFPIPKPEHIKTLKIPEGVISIGPYAFCDFDGSIETIELPSTLKYIAPEGRFEAFGLTPNDQLNVVAIKKIIVNENNKTYSSIDGVLFNKDKTKLIYYPIQKTDKSYIIPSTVTFIPLDAFPPSPFGNLFLDEDDDTYTYSHRLRELTIPINVKRLATHSINSLNLEKLTIENPDITIEKHAFGTSFWYKKTYWHNKTELLAPSNIIDKYFYPVWESEFMSGPDYYESYAVDPLYPFYS